MACHSFHEVTLAVHQDRPEMGAELTRLLHDLMWVRTAVTAQRPALCLVVYGRAPTYPPPRTVREVFRAAGFWGLEQGEDWYLTDGSSLMHLQATRGQGAAGTGRESVIGRR
jgi:hypothetical protein